MWSQYDEDLSQNTFFKEIKHHHEDILKKASEEHWIICVPRTGSFSTDSFSVPVILDHVLVPQSSSLFVTLNKKEVLLENHHLKLNKTDIFLWDVEVLFEETHYIGETSKFLVWCVNSPLFLVQNQWKLLSAENNNIVLCSVQDCIDFLYSETFGHNLLEGIKTNCDEFWKNCDNSFATESLQGQKDFLGNLYSQCLQLCFKSDIVREKSVRDLSYLENFKLSIECYMQYCLGKKLLYNMNTLNHFADCLINKTIRNSAEVTLVDLGICQDFSEFLIEAKYELSRLNNFVTVLDKVHCLGRVLNLFNKKSLNGNEKQLYVTSDDFLQLLVYLILKSNIPNWIGNLTYLKEFQFSGLGNSEHARFLVASLEAAIAFIKSSQFLDIKSQKVHHQSDGSIQSFLFNECYSKLKETRDVNDLDGILANHKASRQAALCHPLCSCVKCQGIESCMSIDNPLEVLNGLSQNYIIQATLDKDQNFLEFLLNIGCDINCKDTYSKTALHYAAQCGFQDILFLLISYHAEVNIFDDDRNTPLHLACDKGHDNCVKALIYSSHFVEVNLQNQSGETPLFLATRWGYFDIVKILLENGASVCITNNRNLNVCKLSPNYYITRLFLEFGKHKSNTITEETSLISVDDQATTLIKKEVIEDSVDCSLLEECCMNFGVMPKTASDFKKIELLLKVIENNDMPMMCFYLGFQTNCMDDTPSVNTYNCHPLCRCNQCFQKDSTDYPTEPDKTKNKFNINMCNKDGFTPLHVAAKFGRTEILRVLLDSGSMLNVRTYKTFYTPLHLAVIFQRLQTVKELLQCGGCEVDPQDSKGYTPLYYACIANNSNLKILELLLQNGADCRKIDFEEKTILQICEEKNLFRVCRILRESMGYSFHGEKSSDKLNNCDFDAIV